MVENLLIIFTKKLEKGKVKTRLAAEVGDGVAFAVFKELLDITATEVKKISDTSVYVYVVDSKDMARWADYQQYVQQGDDLGERMKTAFQEGFNKGFKRIVGIGSDLPDITVELIQDAFNTLESSDTVFGPAVDGGYYLLGMNQLYDYIFDDQQWSTQSLLKTTIERLNDHGQSVGLLKELNDIDTLEDLENSSVFEKFKNIL